MLVREFRRLFFHSRRSTGVTVFAFLLITSSFIHIHKLIGDIQLYVDMYGYMPPWLIVLRYSFSWLQRILGILAAVGLFTLNDLGRKLAIVIGCFTILTVYWKHPYPAFKMHTAYLDQHFGQIFRALDAPRWVTFSSLTVPAIIIHCLGDILFCGSLIYFLTRPSVKQQFRSYP